MSTGPIDPDRIADAVRHKMLLCAFGDRLGGDCDARVGALLCKAGMLKRGFVPPEIPTYLVEALRDPAHPARLPLDHSPVVLVKTPDAERAADIVSALELLCAFSRDAREASLVHLGREPLFLSPLSQRVLGEYADDIRATDIDRGLPAAMRVERVLDSDFTLNLAGFRVGGQLRSQELQQHYWLSLVRDSLESLLSMNDDGYRLFKPVQQRSETVAALVSGRGNALEALSSYDDALGHLPLHALCDIGAAMKLWLVGQAPPDFWDSLREWCSSSAHPLRALQAAVVAVTNQSLVPRSAREWLQDMLRGLVAPRNGNPTDRVNEAIFQLEAECARYYFRFIELRVPGLDVDRVASVSWWAARKIADVIAAQAMTAAKPCEFVNLIRKRAVLPAVQRCELEWHASHPRSGDASIRFGTLFCRQPRILALLIRLSGSVNALGEGLNRSDADAMTGAFVEHQIGCFPIEAVASENAVWAFDAPLAPAFGEWIASVVPLEDRGKLSQLVALGTAAADTQRLTEELEGIAKVPESTRRFLAHLFRVAAYCRRDAAEHLWRLAMSPAWREVCFKELPLEAIEVLFDGIVEVSRRVSDVRILELPHIFVQRQEDRHGGEERQSWFFALTLLAAMAVGRVSAVRRMVNVPNRDRDLASIAKWTEQLREMLPLSPPILQGTLRDALSSLRPT